MNPFFVNSFLLLDRFESAFHDHDRIFQELRSRHEPAQQGHRSGRAPAGSHRAAAHQHSGIIALSRASQSSALGVRRQFTLAREGIKPMPSACPAARTSQTQPSGNTIKPPVPANGRAKSPWQLASPPDSGEVAHRGLHTCFTASPSHTLLAIHKGMLCDGYVLSMQVKLIQQSQRLLHLVLAYHPEDMVILQLDMLQRTIGLYHCTTLPGSLQDVLSAECLVQQSFTLQQLWAGQRFHPLSVTIAKGLQVRFMDTLILQMAMVDRDWSGGCGVLCMEGCQQLIVKDWVIAPLAASSASAAAAAAGAAAVPEGKTGTHNHRTSSKQCTKPAVAVPGDAMTMTSVTAKLASLRFDRDLIDTITADLITTKQSYSFDSIAGLHLAKRLLQEAVLLPILLPEAFTGLTAPWKGILLFGPPGTGKTMLAKAVAGMSHEQCAFFNCSGASLVSKWRGDSEKMVRCLFEAARLLAPSVIFLDEADALLSKRGGEEHEASRRMKTEFFSQMDGLQQAQQEGRVLVLAATNCPWDLDPAALRRLEKRVYVPLPDASARKEHFRLCIQQSNAAELAEESMLEGLAAHSDGLSGADIQIACRDAAMAPMRRLVRTTSVEQIRTQRAAGSLIVPQMTAVDLEDAVRRTLPSVDSKQVAKYEDWNAKFGCTE